MKFALVAVLASALLGAAAPAPVDEETRIVSVLKARNPSCHPVCMYPGDTCCFCCNAKRAPLPEPEVLAAIKERAPYCVPFCQYPGDTVCGCW
jgi:hypothetical protein